MLSKRILSSLILAPPVIAAAWWGSWALAAAVAVVGLLVAWEWTRLCLGRFGAGGMVLGIMAVLVAFCSTAAPLLALAAIVTAAAVAPLAQRLPGRSPLWMLSGALYIGLPILSLVWLREQGRATLFWLLLVVWATDIGAYAAGRAIGGPKLLPRVSPAKTWAGLAGGAIAAAAVGAVSGLAGQASPVALAVLSAGLAVVSQAGDLGESWVKRRFGVKDTSAIIPGHGGMLDRVDGLLAAAPVVALLCLLFGGGIEHWQ